MQFDYQSNDKIGCKVAIPMPQPYRDQDGDYLDRRRVTGEQRFTAIGRVVSGQRAAGSTFPVECYVGELRCGEDHPFAGYIRDLIERLRGRNRWQGLQEKLFCVGPPDVVDESASAVAHDRDQPRTAVVRPIEANARVVKREEINRQPLREVVDKMIEVSAGGSGPELAENLNNRRFHPFMTLNADDIGLGLTTRRPIVEAPGARHAAARNPSHGVRFQFELPTETVAD